MSVLVRSIGFVVVSWCAACGPGQAPSAAKADPPAEVKAEAQPAEQAAPPSLRAIAYRCADQTGFEVATAEDGERVTLTGLASGPVTLPITPSASGAKYSDGKTTYWSKGPEATLEVAGAPLRGCHVIADPALLPGSRWRLARIQSMDDTEAVPGDPSKYTLEFDEDGAVSGQADCNRLRGRFSASGTAITLGPLAMTRAMCPPGSLSDRYARSLDSAASWMIVEGKLTIALKADAGILHFERAP